MKWELAIIAAAVLAVAAVSRRLTGTSVTAAMVFAGIGVLVGPLVLNEVTSAPAGEGVRVLAEATLAVVLFADASRIKPRLLRREHAVPLLSRGQRRSMSQPEHCRRRVLLLHQGREAALRPQLRRSRAPGCRIQHRSPHREARAPL